MEVIEEYTTAAVPAVTPEKSVLLELFPFRKFSMNKEQPCSQVPGEVLHIPDWFPGSSLKREAKYAYGLSRKVIEMSFQYTEDRMVTLAQLHQKLE